MVKLNAGKISILALVAVLAVTSLLVVNYLTSILAAPPTPYKVICHHTPGNEVTIEFANEQSYSGHLGEPHSAQTYDTDGPCGGSAPTATPTAAPTTPTATPTSPSATLPPTTTTTTTTTGGGQGGVQGAQTTGQVLGTGGVLGATGSAEENIATLAFVLGMFLLSAGIMTNAPFKAKAKSR